MVESLGSERSIDDVLAGRLRVTLGGKEYVLPVRSIASNRRWVEGLDAELGGLLALVSEAGDDYAQLTEAFTSVGAEQLLELVLAYDDDHILPPEIAEEARPHEVLRAVMDIRRVQNPLADAGLAAMANAIAGMLLPAPTNSPPPSGASKRRRPLKVA